MTVKRILGAAMAIVMAGTLIGCGNNSVPSTSNNNTNTSSTPGSSTQSPANAEYILRVASAVSDSSAGGKTLLEVFEPYVEEHSNGRIDVQVYNNGVLGSDRAMYEALQMGTMEANVAASSALTNFCADFAILDTPFLFETREIAWAALDGDFGQMLNERLIASAGIRLAGFSENGFRNISNNKHPINSMEDLSGLKIRVMESTVIINTMSALGANPTPMSFNELYTALQQGTVDGQDNGVELTYTNKFYEVQPYYTFTRHMYSPGAFALSEAWFQTLPEDLQQVVLDGAKETNAKQRELNLAMEEEYQGLMEQAGVKFNTLSDAERVRWMEATSHVMDDLSGTVSEDVLAAARTINKDYAG